jgi:hypothetical protein
MNNSFYNNIINNNLSSIIDFIINEKQNIENFEIYYINQFIIFDNKYEDMCDMGKLKYRFLNLDYPKWIITILLKIYKINLLDKFILTSLINFDKSI